MRLVLRLVARGVGLGEQQSDLAAAASAAAAASVVAAATARRHERESAQNGDGRDSRFELSVQIHSSTLLLLL
jgi:hypothetical protein